MRGISYPEVRVKEAARLGFKRCLLPKQNQEKMKEPKGVELIGVRTVQEAIDKLFPELFKSKFQNTNVK